MNKPWPASVSHYREYKIEAPAVQALLALSEHIAQSQLSDGLYAWTSMFDLCITQTPVTYPYNGPFLRVSPARDGLIEFRYIDTFETENQWHRTVSPAETIPRFLKFLAQLHWFSREVRAQ